MQRTPTEVLRERGRALVRRSGWRRLVISACSTVVCTLVLFGLLFGVAIVHGDSMNPSFRNNDLVLYSRLGRFGTGGYSAGDVVILYTDEAGTRAGLRKLVKRVVGIPGDLVDITDYGGVLVNGQPLEDAFAVGVTARGGGVAFPLLLEEREYFVLGDNRENSSDSRIFGAVMADQINGKVLALLRAGRP